MGCHPVAVVIVHLVPPRPKYSPQHHVLKHAIFRHVSTRTYTGRYNGNLSEVRFVYVRKDKQDANFSWFISLNLSSTCFEQIIVHHREVCTSLYSISVCLNYIKTYILYTRKIYIILYKITIYYIKYIYNIVYVKLYII